MYIKLLKYKGKRGNQSKDRTNQSHTIRTEKIKKESLGEGQPKEKRMIIFNRVRKRQYINLVQMQGEETNQWNIKKKGMPRIYIIQNGKKMKIHHSDIT